MTRDMKIPREEADTLAPRSIPLGRIAECEEVASLVTYPLLIWRILLTAR
jgi:3-oxoacyl-[acyl-carrier protein] reductase